MFKPERLNRSVVYLQAVLFATLLIAARPASAQSHNFPFRATNYDVQVIIHPENQTISALAKVDFVANEVGRTVLVELHPDLQISFRKRRDRAPAHFWTRRQFATARERWLA